MTDETITVQEWIDSICAHGSYEHDDQIRAYKDKIIVREFDGTVFTFPQSLKGPGKYRNVMNWVLLDDGSAVGWNESPRNGWSFPRTGAATVSVYLRAFESKGMLDKDSTDTPSP